MFTAAVGRLPTLLSHQYTATVLILQLIENRAAINKQEQNVRPIYIVAVKSQLAFSKVSIIRVLLSERLN